MVERTLAIIKPDGVAAHHTGNIIDLIEKNGFDIIRLQKVKLTKDQAKKFYEVHKARSFFNELVDFMTSGPVVIMVLQKEDAIKAWRDLMGDTNPATAQKGTMRKLFGTDVGKNATHGSDSPQTAVQEIKQFFTDL